MKKGGINQPFGHSLLYHYHVLEACVNGKLH